MLPENQGPNPELQTLVARYEAIRDRGETAFLGEKAFLQLITYYERENLLDQALEVVEHALSHHAFSVDFYIRKAQLLIDNHRDDEAMDTLQQAQLYAPNELEIHLLRAEIMAYGGLHDEALELVHDLMETASGDDLADLYFSEALVYECGSNFEAMFYALESALNYAPHHSEALDRLWVCVEITRKYDESLVLLERILDKNAYTYQAWQNMGHAYAYKGRYNDAIEAYEYAFLSNPDFEEAYRDCADLCFEFRQYQRALHIYQEIMERFEPDGDLYFHMGQCYQALEQPQMARTFFLQSLRLDPMDDEVFYHLGCSFGSEGLWSEAIHYFQKAINIEDKQEDYYAAMADACYELDRMDDAIYHYRMAVKQSPSEPRHWLSFAMLLLDLGRTEEALELLHEAEAHTTGPELSYCRVACLLGGGRRQEALYWLGEALDEDYDMHRYLFDLIPDLRNDTGVISVISAYHGG